MQMSDDNARIGSPAGRSADEPHIGKYRLIKTIGKGNFAKVKLAKHLPTGRQVIFSAFILMSRLPRLVVHLGTTMNLLGSGVKRQNSRSCHDQVGGSVQLEAVYQVLDIQLQAVRFHPP